MGWRTRGRSRRWCYGTREPKIHFAPASWRGRTGCPRPTSEGGIAGWRASWCGTPTCCGRRRCTRKAAGITRSRRAATTSMRWASTSEPAAGCTTCCRSPFGSRARSSDPELLDQAPTSRPARRRGAPLRDGGVLQADLLDQVQRPRLRLMLGAVEYGLGTRDTAFFHERLPFYGSVKRRPSGSTSDRGPHPRVRPAFASRAPAVLADWNDTSAQY